MPDKRRRPQRRARVNPGRRAAVRALMQIEQGGHAEEVLPELVPQEARDRGLAWHLVFGVQRHASTVDAAISRCSRTPLSELDPAVRGILRVGAFEIIHGGTKRYAAVNEGVELARRLKVPRAGGLINAVLRRVNLPEDLTAAERAEHPQWLWDRWVSRYGEEAAVAWCKQNNTQPPLVLVTGQPEAVQAAFAESEVSLEAIEREGARLPGVFRVTGHAGRVEELPGFEEGLWWVQDPASVWTCDLVPAESKTVLDVCAAPGGKTLRLASRGMDVLATDLKPHRLKALQSSVDRVGYSVETKVHDWLSGPVDPERTFDAVLVDAPCTGLGTVRRRPEIRWRRSPFDPLQMQETQLQILANAAKQVRPGGALVYIVCSSEPEECPQVIERFLSEHPEFTVDVTRDTTPPRADEDAFQAVRLYRA